MASLWLGKVNVYYISRCHICWAYFSVFPTITSCYPREFLDVQCISHKYLFVSYEENFVSSPPSPSSLVSDKSNTSLSAIEIQRPPQEISVAVSTATTQTPNVAPASPHFFPLQAFDIALPDSSNSPNPIVLGNHLIASKAILLIWFNCLNPRHHSYVTLSNNGKRMYTFSHSLLCK